VEGYLLPGRAASHWRFQASLGVLYGNEGTHGLGDFNAARLLAGTRFVSDPEASQSFLFELGAGASYYRLASCCSSVPMLASTLGVGLKMGNAELAARVSGDTFLALESMVSATASLGYAFGSTR
jgi:hypothetical protein